MKAGVKSEVPTANAMVHLLTRLSSSCVALDNHASGHDHHGVARARNKQTQGRRLLLAPLRVGSRSLPPLFATQAQLAKRILEIDAYRGSDSHSMQSYLSQVLSGGACSDDLGYALLAVTRRACEDQGRSADATVRELAGILRPNDPTALLLGKPHAVARVMGPLHASPEGVAHAEPASRGGDEMSAAPGGHGFAQALQVACEMDLNITHPDQAMELFAAEDAWQAFEGATRRGLLTRVIHPREETTCVEALLTVWAQDGRWSAQDVRDACSGEARRLRFLAIADAWPLPFVVLRDGATGERSGYLPATVVRRHLTPPMMVAHPIAESLHRSCFLAIEPCSDGVAGSSDLAVESISRLLRGDAGIHKLEKPTRPPGKDGMVRNPPG